MKFEENDIKEDGYILTSSGKLINVIEPTEDMIDIEAIAHSLSLHTRFAGHTRKHYSVARHSIWVAKHSGKYFLEGLMHDATEAYLVDIPRPIKPFLINYKDIENKLMQVIFKKYDLQYPLPQKVHDADRAALLYELNNVFYSENNGSDHEKDEEDFMFYFVKYMKLKVTDVTKFNLGI